MPTDNDDGYEVVTVSHKGVSRDAIADKVHDRGVTVEIFFFCEPDYHWSLAFSFHKGCTYGKARLIRKEEAADLGLDDQVIWRD